MKKSKPFIILFVLSMFLIQACAWIETNTDTSETIARISSRRIGYAIGKDYPKISSEVTAVCRSILIEGNESQDIFKALTDHLAGLLGEQIDDPLLAEEIKDLCSLIEIKPDIEIDSQQIRLIKIVAAGVIAGVELSDGKSP